MPGSGSAWSAPRRSSTSKKSCTPAGDCARSERQRRQILMDSVLALPPAAGITAAACTALGLSRATVPARPPDPAEPAPRPSPPRALTAEERQAVLDQLREPRFADLAPAEVYATLLDEGVYLCSIRTLYRILDDHDEVRERPAAPPGLHQARTARRRPRSGLVVGYHEAGRTGEMDLLLSLRHSRHLQPPGRRLVRRRCRPCSRRCSTTPSKSTPCRPAS